MARNNFDFLEYWLQLAGAGRVFPDAILGRAVAVGTVHNEMRGLQPGIIVPEAELALLPPRTTAKGTLQTLSGIAIKL
jgi:hypothetical protein